MEVNQVVRTIPVSTHTGKKTTLGNEIDLRSKNTIMSKKLILKLFLHSVVTPQYFFFVISEWRVQIAEHILDTCFHCLCQVQESK